eukprot:2360725-Rhodomonas_salina.6
MLSLACTRTKQHHGQAHQEGDAASASCLCTRRLMCGGDQGDSLLRVSAVIVNWSCSSHSIYESRGCFSHE